MSTQMKTQFLRRAASTAAIAVLLRVAGCDSGSEPATAAGTPEATPTGSVPPSPTPAAAPTPTPSPQIQGTKTPTATTAPAGFGVGPQLTFSKPVYDFGVIWDTGGVTCTFPFTNTGSELLRIQQIKPGCGCTATTLDRYEFKPGEGSQIEVTFNPTGAGRQNKSITVLSNDRKRETKLTLVAMVREFVEVSPKILKFDEVALGKPHTKTVQFTSIDPNLEITAIEPVIRPGASWGIPGGSEGQLTAEIVGRPSENSKFYTLAVTMTDKVPWGAVYGTVNVYSRGRVRPGEPTIEHDAQIIVNASAVGDLRSSEQMMRVGVVPPGGMIESTIRLESISGRPFTVTAVRVGSCNPSTVTVKAVPVRGESAYDITISGPSGRYVGQVAGHVVVNTDVEGEEELFIRIAGIVRDLNK